MKIAIISPEPPAENAGNETTSDRWRRILEDLGHTVDVAYEYDPSNEADALLALHAYKSDAGIREFARRHPGRPLIVALTGTDLYRYRHEHPEVDENIERADALVTLQEAALDELPDEARAKAHVVYQSVGLVDEVADRTEVPVLPPDKGFEVVVAAHLRDVKDPLRTAAAARQLDAESGLRVTHVGRALSDEWRERAEDEQTDNSRYQWLGEIPRPQALALIERADLLAVTSVLEGGPNVISEAVALKTPVVASRISGNVGLLGDEYPGYFEAEDTAALARLLERAEGEEAFYQSLRDHCAERYGRFEPEAEREAFEKLLASL
jgi:putative glycosyltransferase (TIGR04348 family)